MNLNLLSLAQHLMYGTISHQLFLQYNMHHTKTLSQRRTNQEQGWSCSKMGKSEICSDKDTVKTHLLNPTCQNSAQRINWSVIACEDASHSCCQKLFCEHLKDYILPRSNVYKLSRKLMKEIWRKYSSTLCNFVKAISINVVPDTSNEGAFG